MLDAFSKDLCIPRYRAVLIPLILGAIVVALLEFATGDKRGLGTWMAVTAGTLLVLWLGSELYLLRSKRSVKAVVNIVDSPTKLFEEGL